LKLQKTPALIIIVIGLLFIIFDDDFYVGFSLVIPVIIYTIITWKKDWKNYRTLAGIISLLAIIHPLLFVQIIKILCGRIRFRDLEIGFTNFTPWFLPPGLSWDNKSFPSGHTAMSFMLLPLLIPLMLIIVVIGWAIFVAASRVIVGAHYASDVLFSGGVACIITILLYKWHYVKRE
jgi:membrane-associated phospholipid phosphatase